MLPIVIIHQDLPLKFSTQISCSDHPFLSFQLPSFWLLIPFSFQSIIYLSFSILSLSSLSHEQPLSPFWLYSPASTTLMKFHSYIRLSRVARGKSQNCSECCPCKSLVSNLSWTFCSPQQFSCELAPFRSSFLSQSSICNRCHFPQTPSFYVSHPHSKDISSLFTENMQIILSFQHPPSPAISLHLLPFLSEKAFPHPKSFLPPILWICDLPPPLVLYSLSFPLCPWCFPFPPHCL